MDSNIGRGNMTMFYTAKDYSGASAGFDLDMEDVMVEKLIGLYPAIDTLVPMLRSFEGVVDCQVTATCKMDSTMSLELPSLHSACYLHGKTWCCWTVKLLLKYPRRLCSKTRSGM